MRLTSFLFSKVGYWSKKWANLPDRYIKRTMEKVEWKPPPGKPQFLPRKLLANNKPYFSIHRPWTEKFELDNVRRKRREFLPIEPVQTWSFFRGDRVEVLVGKDKGKQGIVETVIQERNWVIVGGLNTKISLMGKSKDFPGVLMKEEKPLLVTTQVKLVDPFDLKATTIEWRYMESGERVRVSTRTGRVIPMPQLASETIDYKSPQLYKDQPKDTAADDVTEVTFQPALKTFEMDIMDKMGIKEERIPKKYYWY